MRRMFLFAIAAAVVMLASALPAQADCHLYFTKVNCVNGHVGISWNYATTQDCWAEVIKIEKKCTSGGNYYTVCEGECTSPWTDPMTEPIGCLSGTYTYRLTMRCHCPTQVIDTTWETDPITCPYGEPPRRRELSTAPAAGLDAVLARTKSALMRAGGDTRSPWPGCRIPGHLRGSFMNRLEVFP